MNTAKAVTAPVRAAVILQASPWDRKHSTMIQRRRTDSANVVTHRASGTVG